MALIPLVDAIKAIVLLTDHAELYLAIHEIHSNSHYYFQQWKSLLIDESIAIGIIPLLKRREANLRSHGIWLFGMIRLFCQDRILLEILSSQKVIEELIQALIEHPTHDKCMGVLFQIVDDKFTAFGEIFCSVTRVSEMKASKIPYPNFMSVSKLAFEGIKTEKSCAKNAFIMLLCLIKRVDINFKAEYFFEENISPVLVKYISEDSNDDTFRYACLLYCEYQRLQPSKPHEIVDSGVLLHIHTILKMAAGDEFLPPIRISSRVPLLHLAATLAFDPEIRLHAQALFPPHFLVRFVDETFPSAIEAASTLFDVLHMQAYCSDTAAAVAGNGGSVLNQQEEDDDCNRQKSEDKDKNAQKGTAGLSKQSHSQLTQSQSEYLCSFLVPAFTAILNILRSSAAAAGGSGTGSAEDSGKGTGHSGQHPRGGRLTRLASTTGASFVGGANSRFASVNSSKPPSASGRLSSMHGRMSRFNPRGVHQELDQEQRLPFSRVLLEELSDPTSLLTADSGKPSSDAVLGVWEALRVLTRRRPLSDYAPLRPLLKEAIALVSKKFYVFLGDFDLDDLVYAHIIVSLCGGTDPCWELDGVSAEDMELLAHAEMVRQVSFFSDDSTGRDTPQQRESRKVAEGGGAAANGAAAGAAAAGAATTGSGGAVHSVAVETSPADSLQAKAAATAAAEAKPESDSSEQGKIIGVKLFVKSEDTLRDLMVDWELENPDELFRKLVMAHLVSCLAGSEFLEILNTNDFAQLLATLLRDGSRYGLDLFPGMPELCLQILTGLARVYWGEQQHMAGSSSVQNPQLIQPGRFPIFSPKNRQGASIREVTPLTCAAEVCKYILDDIAAIVDAGEDRDDFITGVYLSALIALCPHDRQCRRQVVVAFTTIGNYLMRSSEIFLGPFLRLILRVTEGIGKIVGDEPEELLLSVTVKALRTYKTGNVELCLLACKVVAEVGGRHPGLAHKLFMRREIEDILALFLYQGGFTVSPTDHADHAGHAGHAHGTDRNGGNRDGSIDAPNHVGGSRARGASLESNAPVRAGSGRFTGDHYHSSHYHLMLIFRACIVCVRDIGTKPWWVPSDWSYHWSWYRGGLRARPLIQPSIIPIFKALPARVPLQYRIPLISLCIEYATCLMYNCSDGNIVTRKRISSTAPSEAAGQIADIMAGAASGATSGIRATDGTGQKSAVAEGLSNGGLAGGQGIEMLRAGPASGAGSAVTPLARAAAVATTDASTTDIEVVLKESLIEAIIPLLPKALALIISRENIMTNSYEEVNTDGSCLLDRHNTDEVIEKRTGVGSFPETAASSARPAAAAPAPQEKKPEASGGSGGSGAKKWGQRLAGVGSLLSASRLIWKPSTPAAKRGSGSAAAAATTATKAQLYPTLFNAAWLESSTPVNKTLEQLAEKTVDALFAFLCRDDMFPLSTYIMHAQLFDKAPLCACLAYAMICFPNNTLIQRRGIEIYKCLADNNMETGNLGMHAPTALMVAMTKLVQTPEIQTSFARLVIALASDGFARDNLIRYSVHHGLHYILREKVPESSQLSCRALQIIGAEAPALITDGTELIAAILDSMDAHIGDQRVQVEGLKALLLFHETKEFQEAAMLPATKLVLQKSRKKLADTLKSCKIIPEYSSDEIDRLLADTTPSKLNESCCLS